MLIARRLRHEAIAIIVCTKLRVITYLRNFIVIKVNNLFLFLIVLFKRFVRGIRII